MSLKAVLFDFNGVIIDDEPIHHQLLQEVLVEENLRVDLEEIHQVCLGKSDRVGLRELLERKGRVVSDEYILKLMARKSQAYQEKIAATPKLPIYPDAEQLIFQLRVAKMPLAVVSGAVRVEIETVLTQANLRNAFSLWVGGDDITVSKPDPDGYLLAVERFNQLDPNLQLKPEECLVIEDTRAGIQAAKAAGMPVVGVAHTYPFHMLHRLADWTVDYLGELELDRIQQAFGDEVSPAFQSFS